MDFKLRENDEFIKLGQLLKACNLVSSGVEAKIFINDGHVKVNNETCSMRGKKIYREDKVLFNDKEVNVI